MQKNTPKNDSAWQVEYPPQRTIWRKELCVLSDVSTRTKCPPNCRWDSMGFWQFLKFGSTTRNFSQREAETAWSSNQKLGKSRPNDQLKTKARRGEEWIGSTRLKSCKKLAKWGGGCFWHLVRETSRNGSRCHRMDSTGIALWVGMFFHMFQKKNCIFLWWLEPKVLRKICCKFVFFCKGHACFQMGNYTCRCSSRTRPPNQQIACWSHFSGFFFCW